MDYRQDWLRFFQGGYQQQINAMVQKWDKIGIVSNHQVVGSDDALGIPKTLWVESELDQSLVEKDPSFEQLLDLENILTAKPRILKGTKSSKHEASTAPENRPVYKRNERL